MALLVAVFCLIFYFLRASADKAALRSVKERKRKHDLWAAAVTDEGLERKLREFIDDPKNAQQVFEEVAAVYAVTPLCSDLSESEIRKDIRCFKSSRDNLALRIMLARRGKVAELDTHTIYPPDLLYKDEYRKAFRLRFEQLMIWMSEEYKRHGITVPLVLEVPPDIRKVDSFQHEYFSVEEAPNVPYRFARGATYIWQYEKGDY